MPKFTYKAKKGPTEVIQGEIDAENEDDAVNKIAAEGLTPIKLVPYTEASPVTREEAAARHAHALPVPASPAGAPHASHPSKPAKHPSQEEKKEKAEEKPKQEKGKADVSRIRVRHRDFNVFTRQFAILLKANVPLLRIFGVLQSQTENKKFRQVLSEVQEHLRKGKSLSEALKFYPRIFSQLYINMVESGEISGTLDTVLMRLAEFSEREAEVRSKVQSALVYPIFLFLVGIGTVFVLLTFILPRLMGVFTDLGVQLPAITRAVIALSSFCQKYWILMGGAAAAATVYFRWRGLSAGQRKFLDQAFLNLPLFGKLVRKSEIARFLRSLELLYEHGIALHKAVEVSVKTISNQILKQELEKLPESLRAGETLTKSLQSVPLMTEFVTNMVSVGEESGKLGDAVRETASFYEQETGQMIKIATTLIEPFMILFIGSIIGFIIIAMLLPIFEISALAR